MGRKHLPKADAPENLPQGHGGKLANDTNKTGLHQPSPINQGRRTPLSRNDRDTLLGADNQSHTRKGGPGTPSGRKPV